MSRRTLAALVLGLLTFSLVVGVGSWRYFDEPLERERERIISTPSLAGLFSRENVTVRGGETACVGAVTLPPELGVVRMRVFAEGRRAVPVRFSAEGPGYRRSTVIRSYPAGQDVLLDAQLEGPEREVRGRICVENLSRRGVLQLAGTGEGRSIVAAQTVVDGEPVTTDVELYLLEGGTGRVLDRLPVMVERMAALTGFLPVWATWVLLVLTVLGLPLMTLAALAHAALRDARAGAL
jgi:hypothetical protein